jgi:acyl-CoA thioester hydrolase
MSRPERSRRSDYRHFTLLTTRWADNDVFGHVNNVMYYNWFDTAVTGHLLEKKLMDPIAGDVQTLVVETGCSYFSSVAFPDTITIGIAITNLGTSSMRYAIGIFREDEDLASAQGHLIHVAVARATGRPVPLPDIMRHGLETIKR